MNHKLAAVAAVVASLLAGGFVLFIFTFFPLHAGEEKKLPNSVFLLLLLPFNRNFLPYHIVVCDIFYRTKKFLIFRVGCR